MTERYNWLRTVFVTCMALAATNSFAQFIWAEDDKNNLFKIDSQNNLTFVATIWGAGLGSASPTMPSTMAVDFTKQITDIAFVGNNLYGITPDTLFSINQSTGAASFVMSLGNDAATRPFTSLVYDPLGKTLLAADDPKNTALGLVPGQLFSINLANNSIQTVNGNPTGSTPCTSSKSNQICSPDTNVAFRSSGDLTFVGNQLFLSSNTPTADTLVPLMNGQGPLVTGPASTTLIDKATGKAVPQVWGLATVGTELYGLAGQTLYTIDSSGVMTAQKTYGTDGVSKFNGATYGGDAMVTNVPEPSTYAMLLAGLGFVGFVARRRLPATAR